MRMTIFKYEFELTGQFEILLPVGARILHASTQPPLGPLCLWALVDCRQGNEPRRFKLFGTGHDIEHIDRLTHVSTIQDGAYVWHLFEVIQP